MSKVTVTREQFIEAFKRAWDEINRGPTKGLLESLYDDKKPWTEIMCGRSPGAVGGRSLVQRTFDNLDFGMQLHFDPERSKVDAFGRVFPGGQHRDHADGVNVVMLEVENETQKSYEEFWKLVQSRCPLKVLISYEASNSQYLKKAKTRMREIHARYCEVLGADDPRAYLLVVGTRDSGKPDIYWMYYGMAPDGNFTEVVE